MEGKPGVALLREEIIDEFCNTCKENANSSSDNVGQTVWQHWEKGLRELAVGRDRVIDWLLMETRINSAASVSGCVVPLLERLTECIQSMEKSSEGLGADVVSIITYELALYSVAALIQADSPQSINSLLKHPFPKKRESYRNPCATGLGGFRHYSRIADGWNNAQPREWLSPEAQKMKEGSSHQRITFPHIVEAEAVVFIANTLMDQEYYPSTAAYAENGPLFPWFKKAKVGRSPDRLAIVMDKPDWDSVRGEFIPKFQANLRHASWPVFRHGSSDYLEAMGFNE